MGQGGRGNRLGCGLRLRRKDQSVLTWRRGDARCAQAVRDHFYAYGRTRGFLTTHARLVEGGKGLAVPQGLDLYCHDFCGCSKDSSPCEHYQLFLGGLRKRGQRKPSRCTRKRTLILLRILAVLPVSRPGVPPRHYRYRLGLARWSGSQTARRSVPTMYQRMAARPVWTGGAIYGV